jgi:hypothetical protein
MREGTDKYDDTDKGGYSYAEKLALASQGLLDPQEIGLPPEDAGIKAAQEELHPKPKALKLGDFVTVEASVVPPQIRARWERQDLAVQPDNSKAWEADWCEQHKNEFAIQGLLTSGFLAAKVGQIFSDPILGFVQLLRNYADLLEHKYNELKQTDPNPIMSREEYLKAILDDAAKSD